MKAVILAGGKGTRLRPLTCNIPKPMVPLLDRPVMEYTIELLKKHGITEIAVTMQHLPEVIRQYFGDGSEFGVRLHYFEEDTPLGTAGSVKNAEEFLDETFIVISGDALTDFDLSVAVAYHRDKQAIGTLLLTNVELPLDFGVVVTNEDGEITRFLEKPGWGEVFSDTVNTGIYILEPEIFQFFDRGIPYDFSNDLFPLLLMVGCPLYGYEARGYWSDIGNLTQYRQTQFDMLDRKVDVSIHGAEILPQVWIGERVKIHRNITFNGPAFIGNECVLEDGVSIGSYSVIGSGSMLKRQSALERAVIWRRAIVNQCAEVRGATLGRQAIVGSGAVVYDGAVIGDSSQIGLKSFVQPGMKVWPNKTVDNYTRLSQSFIWGEKRSKALFGQWGVKGSCQSEMTTAFANKLALAFGTILPVGQCVGVGHDESPYAGLIAEALAAGLHASGLNTGDFGAVHSAVSRYAVYQGDYVAGLHVRRFDSRDDEQYVVEFFDETGLPIPREAERKVEQALFQDDFRRIKPQQAGCAAEAHAVIADYREHILKTVETAAIRDMRFTVAIHCDSRHYQDIFPELLEILGCRVVQIDDPEAGLHELSRTVKIVKADLGVSLDTNGQLINIVARDGLTVDAEIVGLLQIIMQMRQEEGPLHVPVNLPAIVEWLGEAYNRTVIRTKADVRSMMEGCRKEGLYLRFDGMYMLVRLLEFMASEGKSLSQLARRIPRFALSRRMVECPWQDKGKIMRFLLEDTRGKQVELIDGIKIFHEEGWTLVLPDIDEPVFRVIVSSYSLQKAEELATACARKIEDYKHKITVS